MYEYIAQLEVVNCYQFLIANFHLRSWRVVDTAIALFVRH